MYLNPLQSDAPEQTVVPSFCFPYGLNDPQFELLNKNFRKDFRCQGEILKDLNKKPVVIEHQTLGGIQRTPLYVALTVQIKSDLPAHIELSPGRLRKRIDETRPISFCPDRLSRYFVAFEDTLVTVCADHEPNEGLAHRIDYRQDKIGQPTYRVE